MKHSRLNAFLAGIVVSLSCITSPSAVGCPLDSKSVSAFDGKSRSALSENVGASVASPQGNFVDVCMQMQRDSSPPTSTS